MASKHRLAVISGHLLGSRAQNVDVNNSDHSQGAQLQPCASSDNKISVGEEAPTIPKRRCVPVDYLATELFGKSKLACLSRSDTKDSVYYSYGVV